MTKTEQTIRTLCGPCLVAIRKQSHQPRKALALTHSPGVHDSASLCTDCGKPADYFVGVFTDGNWEYERW